MDKLKKKEIKVSNFVELVDAVNESNEYFVDQLSKLASIVQDLVNIAESLEERIDAVENKASPIELTGKVAS